MSNIDTQNAGSGTARDDPKSSSASALVSTLVPISLQAGAFIILFLILRPRLKRVYQPRTYIETLRDHEKSAVPPDGKFSWIRQFKSYHDDYVLSHQSLDGYLYLRFLKLITIICAVGACITWPVLFPVNATGGGGQKELDLLSFANISSTQKNRYFAHAFLAWIFFGFVLYMVTRETILFINIRHAYMLAPFVASRISSRTVLFTDVPTQYQSKEKLTELFGATMRRCWLTTNCKELSKTLEERDKTVVKLENAEIKLSQKAVKAKIKWDKKNNKTKQQPPRGAEDTEAANGVSQWLTKKDRPTHRLGKIPFIGKKVDTIEWGRQELKNRIPEILKSQRAHSQYEGTLLSAVFVEFVNQAAAQAAYRRMSVRHGPKLNPRAIDTAPDQVIWENLKIGLKQRATRKFVAQAFITAMIIFWAIPVAVVGAISNINYLTKTVPFLGFINSIPSVVLGVVTGLLPAVMLAVLMALVPIICRFVAKLSGEVTRSAIELKTQGWYMAFQVIQVFLVTTFASGAAAVVSSIIDDPGSATTLLAENLPKASNFFISYFIVQGLGIAAANLLNIGALATIVVLGKILDKSPRKMFNRYIKLSGLGWGTLYPKVGNLAIIAFAYSIISPLVLGFATIGFALIYLATRYNTFYVLTNDVNTTGLAYAKALQQILTGVYLGEVCLLGLFAINTAPGPIAITAVAIGVTAVYHALMRQALDPLVNYLPESYDSDGQGRGPKMLFNQTDQGSYDIEHANGVPPTASAPPTKPGLASRFTTMLTPLTSRLFNPLKSSSHANARSIVPKDIKPVEYAEEDAATAYLHPAVTAEIPRLWYVRDDLGISQREVRDTREVIGNDIVVSDEWAFFDAKGKVKWEGQNEVDKMPLWEGRHDY